MPFNLNRRILLTNDGSQTIGFLDNDLTYHSRHGAFAESMHIFIRLGLNYYFRCHATVNPITVFEVGFGSGLNAFLTWQYAHQHQIKIEYHSIDVNPLNAELYSQLNYHTIDPSLNFLALHTAEWNATIRMDEYFIITKYKEDLLNFALAFTSDVIYFDAFAPNGQPELWTKEVFEELIKRSNHPCVLTTYCSKGEVRRNMQAAGWKVEKYPGPNGKREVVRAIAI